MADRGQPGRRGLAGRIADLEPQRLPVRGGVAGEVKRRSLVGPRSVRHRARVPVPAGLQRAVRPGEREARLVRVLLVDHGVQALRGVAAPVQPPEVDAGRAHLVVQPEVRLQLVGVTEVEDVAVRPAVASGPLQFALRDLLRLREVRVGAEDARVDVQPGVHALLAQPCRERGPVREPAGVDLPAVPPVRRLEVGVHDQRVQWHAFALEARHDGFKIRGGTVVVLRVPDAVGPLRQQLRRAGQRGQLVQRATVVLPVGEDVTVRVPAGGRVVDQRPPVLEEQAGVRARTPVDAVQAAPVPAERRVRRQQRSAFRGHRDGVHVDVAAQVGGTPEAHGVRPGFQGHKNRLGTPVVPPAGRRKGGRDRRGVVRRHRHGPALHGLAAGLTVGVAQLHLVGPRGRHPGHGQRAPGADAFQAGQETVAGVSVVVVGEPPATGQGAGVGLAHRAEGARLRAGRGGRGVRGARRGHRQAVDVHVAGVARRPHQADLVTAGGQGQRDGGQPPGVPVPGRRQAQRAGRDAVDRGGQGAGGVLAVAAGAVGIPDGELLGAGGGRGDGERDRRAGALEAGGEAVARVVPVIGGRAGPVQRQVLGLAQGAGHALGRARAGPRRGGDGLLAGLETYRQIVFSEGTGTDLVTQGGGARVDGQPAVRDPLGKPGRREVVAADHVEGVAVGELAAGGVLGSDQRRRQDLEAGVTGDDASRVSGGVGLGRSGRAQRQAARHQGQSGRRGDPPSDKIAQQELPHRGR